MPLAPDILLPAVVVAVLAGALFAIGRRRPRSWTGNVTDIRSASRQHGRAPRRRRRGARRVPASVLGLLILALGAGGYWSYLAYAPRGLVKAVDAAASQIGGSVIVARIGSDSIHVRDGDTIEVVGQPVRFQGVTCPEIGQSGAGPARDLLVRTLAAGTELRCRLTGERTYDRIAGRCAVDGADLGMTLISAGVCGRCAAYDWIGYYARVASPYAGPVPGYCTGF